MKRFIFVKRIFVSLIILHGLFLLKTLIYLFEKRYTEAFLIGIYSIVGMLLGFVVQSFAEKQLKKLNK